MTQEAQRRRREQAEHRALQAIAERLAAQFPELSLEQVEAAIHGRYAEFDGSRVRDYVPMLVERSVRLRLANG